MFVQQMGSGELRLVTSASDLTAASACEFAFLRRVDARLGRNVVVPPDDDPMLARAAKLGDAHEARVLARYIERFGQGSAGVAGGVIEIARADSRDPAALEAAQAETVRAMHGGAEVVFQATFFDPAQSGGAARPSDEGFDPAIAFIGYADFLRLTPDGSYEVQDTKLARKAKVTALLQLAAYAEQLERLQVPVSDEVVLILGDGATSRHRVADIAPVFRSRRARLHEILLERARACGSDGERASALPIQWAAEGLVACGRCEVCTPEVERTRDPLLIAGIRTAQRSRLIGAGMTTIDAVAEAAPSILAGEVTVPGISGPALERLALQASVQAAVPTGAAPVSPPPYLVIDAAALAAIPAPDPGDLFFDFEGDPLYREAVGGAGDAVSAGDKGEAHVVEGKADVGDPDVAGDAGNGRDVRVVSGADNDGHAGDAGDVRGAGRDERNARWGIDYLFGMVDAHEQFTPIWAHDLADERRALEAFIELVTLRRQQFPGMRIYHYAPYERTHLLSIAARHGVCEAEVDQLLREHVLVDLYPIVRGALRVGSRSYSIKKLEPLYMGEELRDEDGVTSGAQSVTEYAEASTQLLSDVEEDRREGQRRLDAIADYNRYDCVSTLRLRDWLLRIAAEHGVEPLPSVRSAQHGDAEAGEDTLELSPIAAALARHASLATLPEESKAIALAGSAIDYYQREQKSFWWAHYARLIDPIEDWADTRDVLVVDAGESEPGIDWQAPQGRARLFRRQLRLRGEFAPGSSLKTGSDAYLLYAYPPPFEQRDAVPGGRGARQVKIVERHEDGVTVEETRSGDVEAWYELPIALTPGPPPRAGTQKAAIEEWGRELVGALDQGATFADPVYDILRRQPPRLLQRAERAERAERGERVERAERGERIERAEQAERAERAAQHDSPLESSLASPLVLPLVSPKSQAALEIGGSDDGRTIGAVTASLRMLDRSALAVQGPPGTGKTYLAARVIRALVENDGWHIGVVAQSHKVVENVLSGVVGAGLDSALVGKVPQGGKLDPDAPQPAYTVLRPNGHGSFLRQHREGGRGAVIGGTAWDFSNDRRIERRSLDLLVIDEAGQFSLAPTIAAAVSAKRLLLLGDPQQLPQVSQGSHPEPVDTSALGWLLGDHETIPEGHGYFLAETRRMRPELAEVVSELSYEGRLHAHPTAELRRVTEAGEAGLHWHPVHHEGNSTSSPEEAAEVVRIVTRSLNGTLHEPGAAARPLTQEDVIIVAAYNAQVECLAEALSSAGLSEVRVGTVDKFQGQEAVIAVVSLAASSGEDVPRGLDFLLMRNRLNVAISRAQWSAHLVSSSRLGDGLPTTSDGVAALSGYLRLTERGGDLNGPRAVV